MNIVLSILTVDDFETDMFDPEPRISDWRLANALGFGRRSDIHELIERHRTSLERFGPLPYRTVKSGGRPGREYQLNFNQAIFVTNRSEAPNAIVVQIHVVTIYGMWASGDLLPRDTEAEIKLADATEKAFQNAPDLMGLVLEFKSALLAGFKAQNGRTDNAACQFKAMTSVVARLESLVSAMWEMHTKCRVKLVRPDDEE